MLISSLSGGWHGLIRTAAEGERVLLIASTGLVDELMDVVSRPRLRRWFDWADGKGLADTIREWAAFVEPDVSVDACRDPNDNYLLALAEASAADYLVTRDEDLLVLERWKDTEIIPPSRFLTLLAQSSGEVEENGMDE